MSRLKRFVLPMVVMMMMAVLVGCAGTRKAPIEPDPVFPDMKGAPKWVNIERDPDDKSGKNIYAVGTYSGTSDFGLMRDAALENARTRMTLNMRAKVDAINKNYASNVSKRVSAQGAAAGESAVSKDDERKFTEAFITKANAYVTGIEVVDSWTSPKGSHFVLIKLSIDKFKEMTQQMSELDADVKKAIDERAEAAWDELNNGKK